MLKHAAVAAHPSPAKEPDLPLAAPEAAVPPKKPLSPRRLRALIVKTEREASDGLLSPRRARILQRFSGKYPKQLSLTGSGSMEVDGLYTFMCGDEGWPKYRSETGHWLEWSKADCQMEVTAPSCGSIVWRSHPDSSGSVVVAEVKLDTPTSPRSPRTPRTLKAALQVSGMPFQVPGGASRPDFWKFPLAQPLAGASCSGARSALDSLSSSCSNGSTGTTTPTTEAPVELGRSAPSSSTNSPEMLCHGDPENPNLSGSWVLTRQDGVCYTHEWQHTFPSDHFTGRELGHHYTLVKGVVEGDRVTFMAGGLSFAATLSGDGGSLEDGRIFSEASGQDVATFSGQRINVSGSWVMRVDDDVPDSGFGRPGFGLLHEWRHVPTQATFSGRQLGRFKDQVEGTVRGDIVEYKTAGVICCGRLASDLRRIEDGIVYANDDGMRQIGRFTGQRERAAPAIHAPGRDV